MEATVKVRISAEEKQAAQEWAAEQGITLSKAIRRLLTLWVAGGVDLSVIEQARLASFPRREELKDLAEKMRQAREVLGVADRTIEVAGQALGGMIEDTGEALGRLSAAVIHLSRRYEQVLTGEALEPYDDWREQFESMVERLQEAQGGQWSIRFR